MVVFLPSFTYIGAGVSLCIGGAISGWSRKKNGGEFWEGFADYINENWSQTLAISMAIAMATFGVSQAAAAVRNCNGPQCFIAGTLVLCQDENGEEYHKPIEEIEVGDVVWAYDEETGESDWKPVVRLFRNETKEWYHVFVEGEEIVCTGGHPFYVLGIGFVEARNLKTSDKLLLSNGKEAIIEKVEAEQLAEAETTYNFEVEDFHTYYVTEKAVLVHNFCEKQYADYGVKYKENGRTYKAYHQADGPHKGNFVVRDNYGHGGASLGKSGSSFKLLKEVRGSKLELIGDLDIDGFLLSAKHSSNLGKIYNYYGRFAL